MEHILLSANYPNSYGLGIYHIEDETFLRILTENASVFHIIPNQISSLVIHIVQGTFPTLPSDGNSDIFTYIITECSKLRSLCVGPSVFHHHQLSYRLAAPV
ncbi:unnamed protein product [Adineta ricciae]|nr:unnamed protein product [Adineta ricciae]